MSKDKLQFKVHSLRTLSSPYSKEDKDESTLETIYYLLVNMKDLPEGISLEVNPRKPNMKTDVGKELVAAVKEPETDFYINNRGIVMSAKSLVFDTTNSQVTIDLGDPEDPSDLELYGILDGGHTYRAIIENRHEIPSDLEKYVRVEVITNIHNITRVSDARNTSRQVSDIALFNLDENFGDVRAAISGQSYANKIAYKDNEDKDIHVSMLLRLLYAFDIDKYPDDSAAPVQSFSGKAQVFKRYSTAYDTPFYKSLTKQLPKLAELYDTIELEIPQKYREYKESQGKEFRFGGVRGVENVSIDKAGKVTDKTIPSTYSATPTQYQIASGYIYPIYGAFRPLLKYDAANQEVYWQLDPVEVWKEIGTRLVQNTFGGSNNPQTVGKDSRLWLSNYDIVEKQSFRLEAERLRKQLQRQG